MVLGSFFSTAKNEVAAEVATWVARVALGGTGGTLRTKWMAW